MKRTTNEEIISRFKKSHGDKYDDHRTLSEIINL
jgi:hypothetical protein